MSTPAPSQDRPGDSLSSGQSQRPARGPSSEAAETTPSLLERLQEWLDRLLVLDVFLVIGAALWFAVAVVLQAQGVKAPLQLFQSLWEPLFTPAIGLLMAAALLSGALGWWRRRGPR